MEVNIAGLEAAMQNLLRLNIDESLETKALTKAGKITREAVIAEANFGNRSKGTMRKNIKLKRPKDGEVVIHSGGAYHAHLIEFGRSGGSKIGSDRKVTWGPTAANPFFSRGFESSQADAKQAMIDAIQQGLGL